MFMIIKNYYRINFYSLTDYTFMDRKILMHVGPTMIDLDVLLSGVRYNTGFGSPEFIDAMKNSLNGLNKMMMAPDYHPFILPGSGSLAMESVTSLLKKDENVLVISSGVFGDRWKAIFNHYQIKCDLMRSEPGDIVSIDKIMEAVERKHYKMVTMTYVETSTGVRFPVKEVTSKIRKYVDIVVVDAVAAAGGEELNVQDWNIDVCLTASQKALASPPGAALMVLSDNAMSAISENSINGYYTDLGQWDKVMSAFLDGKSGYYTTLPVHIIFSLEESFKLIEKETMEARIKRHKTVAGAIAAGLDAMDTGILAKKEYRSNTVTGMMLNGIDMNAFLKGCLNDGIEMATGIIPEYAGKYVRIGHMGNINTNDAIATIAVIERELHKYGKKFTAGAGVSAVQEYLESL